MAAVATELFTSRRQVLDLFHPTAEFDYVVEGATDEADAISAVQAVMPSGYNSAFPRRIEIKQRLNPDTWFLTIFYDLQPEDWSPAEISFDTTGGTAHITSDLETINTYGPLAATDLQGAIGYDGERVNGVDVPLAVFKFTELHYVTDADLDTNAYFLATGRTNADVFRGYAIGEVLFEGVTGNKRSPQAPYALTFKFSASPNQTGMTIGGITGIDKKGFEEVDIQYGDSVDPTANVGIKEIVKVTIHRVFDSINFSTLSI